MNSVEDNILTSISLVHENPENNVMHALRHVDRQCSSLPLVHVAPVHCGVQEQVFGAVQVPPLEHPGLHTAV